MSMEVAKGSGAGMKSPNALLRNPDVDCVFRTRKAREREKKAGDKQQEQGSLDELDASTPTTTKQ